MTRRLTTPALLLALATAGCGEDAAKDVPKAVVSDAKPVASDPARPSASSTATAAPGASTVAPAASAGTLAITPASTKIGFIGSKTVGGTHTGGFKAFTGTIDLVADKPEIKQIAVDIDTTSIDSDDPKLTGHLKSKDFFEVDKFPTARFVTTEIRAGGDKGATHTLVGNLTLHGVTKSITIPAEVKVDGGTVTIKSEFALDKNDFGMTYGSIPPAIRKDVVVKLDVKGEKKG